MSMWRKAGRPRKIIIDEFDDSKWTKDELTIKHGEIDLAIAVVKQWHLDGCPGCPASDYAGVEPWLGIIISALDNKNSKLGASKIGGSNE